MVSSIASDVPDVYQELWDTLAQKLQEPS